jgi:ATP-dependent helicase YprA (DUF1998 family)
MAWGGNLVDVFRLRRRLVDDYGSYMTSFIRIKDERVEDVVLSSLGEGLLWPDPLIQLNPSFEAGETIDELVAEGVLHEECSRIFRRKRELHDPGEDLRLHRHQAEAIRTARAGHNYVLTTGTGSGKSLAYIVPIVDQILRRGPGRGIQAIVVYPMNALANSQYGELEKFLNYGYPDGKGPVTFARYTGQVSDEERQRIIADPPDVLLTNYVMLELILTRSAERGLVQAAQDLGFLVFNELHTYRGRQGADVAFLIRRVRELLAAQDLCCVGTSATPPETTLFPENEVETKHTIPSIEEAALALHACVPEGEKVQREKLLLDAARELGHTKLTKKVRSSLNQALNVEHNKKRLKTDWKVVWKPKRK